MANGYGYHLPDRVIKPAKIVQTRKRVYCFCGCAGIAAKRRKGCSPLLRQSRQYRSAGKLPCAEIKPSAERTRPLGCISAPLVPKGFLACRSLGSFSQKLPRWLARQGKPEKRGGFFVGHVLCFRHNAFKDRAPDDKAVAARPAFLAG